MRSASASERGDLIRFTFTWEGGAYIPFAHRPKPGTASELERRRAHRRDERRARGLRLRDGREVLRRGAALAGEAILIVAVEAVRIGGIRAEHRLGVGLARE